MSDTKQQLEAFRNECTAEFELFETAWKASLTSKVPLIDKMIGYLSHQRGKGMRPMIAFLAAKVYGPATDATIQSALVMELLHTATLIHDDVVDSSDTRRGFASLRAIWNNKISVLFGDFLLARSLQATLELRRFEALDVLSEIAKRMAKGELQEAALAKELNGNVDDYLDMISDKTAALISGAVRIGVLSTAPTDVPLDKWREFGEALGIAFQIRDDILDYTGTEGLLGKPVGGDLKDSKITLPLLLAFRKASETEAGGVLKRMKTGVKKQDIKEIVAFVKQYNGVSEAQTMAESYARKRSKHYPKFLPTQRKND